MSEIPEDVRKAASKIYSALQYHNMTDVTEAIERAIMAERERWTPAVAYFNGYCQDEAEDVEYCIDETHHECAKALGAVVRASP